MTDDLVKRLRWRAASNENCLCGNPVCDEAASRIEKLEAALRRLIDYGMVSYQDLERASKALEGEE